MGDTGFEHFPQGVMENLSKNLTAIELPQDTLVCDCYSYWLKECLQKLAHKVANGYQILYCQHERKKNVYYMSFSNELPLFSLVSANRIQKANMAH